jgi:hypothetical protein
MITLFVMSQFEFAHLDPGRYSFRHGVMATIRRTINLIIALILVALACGEFIAAIRHSPEN